MSTRTAADLTALAWNAIDRGAHAKADALAREAITLSPTSDAWAALASSLCRRERWHDARAAMDNAVALAPDDFDLLTRSLAIDRTLAVIRAAALALDRAIAARPHDPDPLLAHCDLLMRGRKHRRPRARFRSVATSRMLRR